MNNSAYPDDFYRDWTKMRGWCISYLQIFLEHADKLHTREGWRNWERAMEELPSLDWRKIKRISDDRVRFIVDAITSCFWEAAVTMPVRGTLSDLIAAARELLTLFDQDLSLDVVANEVQRISDEM